MTEVQNSMRNLTQRLDYTPASYYIDSVYLKIELSPHQTIITNTMRLSRREGHTAPLILDGSGFTLLSLSCDDTPLMPDAYELDNAHLTVPHLPSICTLTVVTQINPADNTALEGLYLSNAIFCTQCEAHSFSHMTYFLDRPDVMTLFTTEIIADKATYPYLLSNGNIIHEALLPEGKHCAIWEDPFKKPCYLFALVAGDLDCLEDQFVTFSGRRITLRIFSEKGMKNRCHHAMLSLKKAMRWDEIEYGREYDLDMFMIVAVNDFNMGAMENKGLNIFNSKYILADPETATDSDYEGIQIVVGHEYFHNWTGNRITCRDWFQLSLKEGLTVYRDQTFNADLTSAATSRIDDVRILKESQFTEDSGPLAHPVRPDSYLEVNNLYTATVYNKGAELIRMFRLILKKDGFRQGMDCYFDRFDGQAVTCDDFADALSEGSQIDLTPFKAWYSQSGTPRVRVREHYDQDTQSYTLHLSQVTLPTPDQAEKKPLPIPLLMALFKPSGEPYLLENAQPESLIVLDQPLMDIVFKGLPEKPVLSILRGFSAPVLIEQTQTLDDLYFLLKHETDPFNRWAVSQRLYYRTLSDIIEGSEKNTPYPSHARHLEALTHLLKTPEPDFAFTARLLTLPTLSEIAEQYTAPIPIDAIHLAYETWKETMVLVLYPVLWQIYHQLNDHHLYEFNPFEAGKRRLKNLCLSYLVYTGRPEALALAIEQYHQASNMTDKLAALQAVAQTPDEARALLLSDFAHHFQHDALVMDKWLSLQATATIPDVLDRIKALLTHPVFSYKNPNKVRALIGAFAHNHFAAFHAIDGSGYFFLKDQINIVDRYNPQVAARLVVPLTRWQKLDDRRQTLMKDALNALLARKGISDNLYEIVAKALV